MNDGKENKKGNEKSTKEYSKQEIFGKYTNYGYTSDRTTITDMMSVNTNNTVDINKKQILMIHLIITQKLYQTTPTMITTPSKSNYRRILKLYQVGN